MTLQQILIVRVNNNNLKLLTMDRGKRAIFQLMYHKITLVKHLLQGPGLIVKHLNSKPTFFQNIDIRQMLN